MEIKYLGQSAFLIRTKTAYGKEETKIVTDPFDPQFIGMRFPKTEADIVTVSHGHKDHNAVSQVEGNPLIIDLAGEFEKKAVRIFGFASFHDNKKGEERGANILYKIQAEGINVLHCGDLGLVPDDDFIDQIGEVDVLLIPVGGTYTFDVAEAAKVVHKIEPSIIIPMHYGHDKLKPELQSALKPVLDFLKEMDASGVTPLPKLVIKKEELGGEMKVAVLEI